MRPLRWALVLLVAVAGVYAMLFARNAALALLGDWGMGTSPAENLAGYITALTLNVALGFVPVWAAMKAAPSHPRAVGEWALVLVVGLYLYFYLLGSRELGTGPGLVREFAVIAGTWVACFFVDAGGS